MARLPPLVVPGLPHHVTQRSSGRQQTFFEEGDYALYLDLLADAAEKARAEVWAHCLMPNHVHAIVVPADEDGLRRPASALHCLCQRAGTADGACLAGSLRFSVAMDDAHLFHALRYVGLNPVRANLGRARGRLALVERRRASRRQG